MTRWEASDGRSVRCRGIAPFVQVCCLLLLVSQPAVAGPIIGPLTAPPLSDDKRIHIAEGGPVGATTWIFPTFDGKYFPNGTGGVIGMSAVLTELVFPPGIPPPPFDLGPLGFHTFIVPRSYGTTKVTDYSQQTGDPAVLQASAFDSGVMVDSLWDWLFASGYVAGNPIFQPDFFLVGGGDIYFAVDLAALLGAGRTFVETWSLGSVFSINAAGGLGEMPFYMFSSTPFDYTPGSGWTGGTPVAEGTRLSFDAFHMTDAEQVPEPATLLLVGAGLAGAAVRRRRRSA